MIDMKIISHTTTELRLPAESQEILKKFSEICDNIVDTIEYDVCEITTAKMEFVSDNGDSIGFDEVVKALNIINKYIVNGVEVVENFF